MLVDKNNSAQSLILSTWADSTIDGEVIQKALNLVITHHLWVFLVVKKDELADPVEIRLLGAVAVLLGSDLYANRFQKR
jgi:hypothetical protein